MKAILVDPKKRTMQYCQWDGSPACLHELLECTTARYLEISQRIGGFYNARLQNRLNEVYSWMPCHYDWPRFPEKTLVVGRNDAGRVTDVALSIDSLSAADNSGIFIPGKGFYRGLWKS